MCRGNCNASVGDSSVSLRPDFRPFAKKSSTVATIIFSGLVCLALAALSWPAHSGADQPSQIKRVENPHPHFSDPELAALRAYTQGMGSGQQPQLANVREDPSHQHHFAHADLAALPGHASQTGAANPHIASVEEGDTRSGQFDDTDFVALSEFAKQIGTDRQDSSSARSKWRPRDSLRRSSTRTMWAQRPACSAMRGKPNCSARHSWAELTGPTRASWIARAAMVRARRTSKPWDARPVTASAE